MSDDEATEVYEAAYRAGTLPIMGSLEFGRIRGSRNDAALQVAQLTESAEVDLLTEWMRAIAVEAVHMRRANGIEYGVYKLSAKVQRVDLIQHTDCSRTT